MLDFFHAELAHLPQHLSGTQLGGKKLGEVQLDIEMVWHAAFHFSDPGKDLGHRWIGHMLGFGQGNSSHAEPPENDEPACAYRAGGRANLKRFANLESPLAAAVVDALERLEGGAIDAGFEVFLVGEVSSR